MKNLHTSFVFILLATLFLTTKTAFAQRLSSGPQVLTFFSNIDDSEQPYGLYLPKNYNEKKKYPLVVMLHGAGSNHRLALRRVFGKSNATGETDVEASQYFPEWKDIDFIVVSPYARGTAGYQGVAEHDVWHILKDVKRRFNIDEDRTYLTGLSMGGGGSLWIGLTRPDIWAAIAPVCPAPPNGTAELMPNVLNVPMHFFHGDADPVVPVAQTRDWVQKLKDLGTKVEYTEVPKVGHDSWVKAYENETIFTWFSQFKRNSMPDRVRFVSRTYKYNDAYWVSFDDINDGELATIDAQFAAINNLKITTASLNGFTLNLKKHPKFKANHALTLTIDGKMLTVTPTSATISLMKTGGNWTIGKAADPSVISKKKLQGPISAAFSSRQVYVYGTAGNPSKEEQQARVDAALQAANWSVYRGEFLGRIKFYPRVLSDKEIRPSDLADANLILFGTKETNSIIAQYSNQLPLELNDTKNYGLFYVFPINNHLVAVNSGLPWWTGVEDKGYPFLPAAQRSLFDFKDFVLFKNAVKNVVNEGSFDNNWQFSDTQSAMMKASGVVKLR